MRGQGPDPDAGRATHRRRATSASRRRAATTGRTTPGKHPEIIEACKSIEDRYPPNAFRPKEQLSAEDLRKLAEYAKCFREHGLPAFPDPDSDGSFDFTGTTLANGVPKQLMDKATKPASSIWGGKITVNGGPGGKK